MVTDALMPIDAMRAGDFNGLAKIANGWAPADMAAKFGIPVTSTNTTIYQQFDLVGNKLTPITLSSGTTTYQVSDCAASYCFLDRRAPSSFVSAWRSSNSAV